ncbi:hypothetical protein ACHAQJ_008640 [Trichoderma viride]
MPTSSTAAVCSGSNADNGDRTSQAASDNSTQTVTLPYVLNDATYSIDRFLSKDKETTAGFQRPPPEFREAQSDGEAVAKAEARMRAELQVFDATFFGGNSTRD